MSGDSVENTERFFDRRRIREIAPRFGAEARIGNPGPAALMKKKNPITLGGVALAAAYAREWTRLWNEAEATPSSR